MASLSQAKTYGGVGSILVLLTAVPTVGVILGIAGFILVLIAIKHISEIVADRSIFDNLLIGIVLTIAGAITGTVVIVGAVLSFVGLHHVILINSGSNFNTSSIPTGEWIALITSVLVGLAVIWVMLSVSGIFVRRSYTSIGSKLNIKLFETAGLVYLIGAVTTIIGVGYIVLLIAEILLVIAFFSIEDTRLGISAPQPQRPVSASP
jgi:uncharacterized membrane protein